MNDQLLTEGAEKRPGTARRTVLKHAAWAAPTVAVAVAAPQAAASVGNASVAWTNSQTGLLTLRLLDGGSPVTAQALTTVPTQFTITNGVGAIPAGTTATVTVTVSRPSGINVWLGRARGFSVGSLNGQATTAGQRTVTYPGPLGPPNTSFTGTMPVQIASNGSLNIPIEFGLVGTSSGATVSVAPSFPVSLTVEMGGYTYTASSSISMLANAGIL
jgi:hypothetical protein